MPVSLVQCLDCRRPARAGVAGTETLCRDCVAALTREGTRPLEAPGNDHDFSTP